MAKPISLESGVCFIKNAKRALCFCYFWSSGGQKRKARIAFLLLLELRGNSPSGNESIVRKKARKKSRVDRKFICFRKIYQNRLRPASKLRSKSAKTRYYHSILLLLGAPGSEFWSFRGNESIVRDLGHGQDEGF